MIDKLKVSKNRPFMIVDQGGKPVLKVIHENIESTKDCADFIRKILMCYNDPTLSEGIKLLQKITTRIAKKNTVPCMN